MKYHSSFDFFCQPFKNVQTIFMDHTKAGGVLDLTRI